MAGRSSVLMKQNRYLPFPHLVSMMEILNIGDANYAVLLFRI